MSETNFTEQDREVLLRGQPPGRHAIEEIDSLRLWLRDAQKAANLGGPPTGRTCSVDGHDIYGAFHGEAGIDGPAVCALHWYQRTEDENDSLRAQLGEAQAALLEAGVKDLYCTACKSCGEIGCCHPQRCKYLNAHQGAYDDLVKENVTLRSENARLREALHKAKPNSFEAGAALAGSRGHAPDCEVGAALAGGANPTVAKSATVQPEGEEILEALKPFAQWAGVLQRYIGTEDCYLQSSSLPAIRWSAVRAVAALYERMRAKAQSETGGAA